MGRWGARTSCEREAVLSPPAPLLPHSPTLQRRVKVKGADSLTKDECDALLASAARQGNLAIRDRMMLELMGWTGLRVSELCGFACGSGHRGRVGVADSPP